MPAFAIGLQDFLGTGAYGAEYLVATKTFGDTLRDLLARSAPAGS